MNEIIKEYSLNWKDILFVVVGTFILSFAFQVFLLPNEILSGGISSLSIIVHHITGIPPVYTQYAINIPLIILSFILLGKDVAVKSVLGSLLFPFFTGILSGLTPWTSDLLLASVFGGALSGLGVGLVYKAKGSTGGTSTVAQFIDKYTSLTLGASNLLADGLITLVGVIVFDLETVLYGIISIVILSKIIDVVLVGNDNQKNVLILSDSPIEIKMEILDKFDRGVTLFDVRGGYSNDHKEMLMVVIGEREITALQEMILQEDEDAFVVVMPASEVMGRGFSLEKYFPIN